MIHKVDEIDMDVDNFREELYGALKIQKAKAMINRPQIKLNFEELPTELLEFLLDISGFYSQRNK